LTGAPAAIFGISSGLGYLLPAIIGLESMGIPSPGETALVLAAVLASQGKLEIWLVILIGVASAIAGDNLGYLLGRRFGREVLARPGPLWHHRLRAIRAGDKFFARHGPRAVFLARWIALVRFAAAWLAGINRMPFRQFFFWNALGGITWGITYGLVGYFAGTAGAGVLARFGIAGAIVLLILLIGIPVLRMVRRRRRALREASDSGPPRRGDPPPVARPEPAPVPAGDQDDGGSS
jgi:membrane protein DedA with SNARE-associated domain